MARRRQAEFRVSHERFRNALAGRAVTLLLGAGVSRGRGVPTWLELTRALWSASGQELPGWLEEHDRALAQVRHWAARRHGASFARRLTLARPHPLAEQMALELLERRFAPKVFVEKLRAALYPRPALVPRTDTLGVLARLLRAEQRRVARSVTRVVSFNADDLLEVEANRGHHPLRDPVLWPVARESSNVRHTRGAHGRAPIPVYHPHGFLPRTKNLVWHEAPDTLVFTDAQYWASVASPLSFGNRVIANALHDSSCVFIGLSMFDVNLIRWLGIRYHAVRSDKKSEHESSGRSGPAARLRSERLALERHFWVRLPDDDPERLVSALLKERGVASVEIDGWGKPFERLIRGCFPRF